MSKRRESVAPGFVERPLKQTEVGNMNIKPTDRKYRFIPISIFFFNVIYLAVWDLSCGHVVSIATLIYSMWDLVP